MPAGRGSRRGIRLAADAARIALRSGAIDLLAEPGDPPVLVAGAEQIHRVLGWQPQYGSLDAIIDTAWQWEQSR